MQQKHFLTLVILAMVAVMLAWITRSGPEQANQSGSGVLAAGDRLLPELEAEANDIEQLQIIGAGNQALVTLNRHDTYWGISQRDGYPADWNSVRQMLRELSQAEVIAPKTVRPEFHARLGLADVSADNTGGGLVRWGDGEDDGLLIGIESDGLTARYVRRPGTDQTYLVDQELRVKSDPSDWIDANIIDWQASRLAEITVRPAEGDTIRINRATPDALEMQLISIPEGREVSGQWAVNGIANSLQVLTADDVRKAVADVPDDATRALFVTSDGINLVVSLFTETLIGDDGEETAHYLRAEASLEPQTAAETVAEAVPEAPGDEALELAAVNADPAEEVSRLQSKLNGWDFLIPEFKFNAMNKRLDDLLKPLPQEEPAEG